jgi:hypothetical protein
LAEQNLSRASDKRPNIFLILFQICLGYPTFRACRVLSVYGQIFSAYSQNTNKLIFHNQQIHTTKLHLKIYFIPYILCIRTDSFPIFSVWIQIHSAFLANSQIILKIRNEIQYFAQLSEGEVLDIKSSRSKLLFCSSLTKKKLFLFCVFWLKAEWPLKKLSNFFVKNNFGKESVTKRVLLIEKNTSRKSHASSLLKSV